LAQRSSRFVGARAGSAALLSLSGLLLSKAALAQAPPGIDLRWEAPPACPQQGDVQERIWKLVGSQKPSDTRLSADGAITQTEDARFQLKLVLHVGSLVGERALESKSCRDLAGAAAVTIALLLRSPEPLSERDLGQLAAPSSEPEKPAQPPASIAVKAGPSASNARSPRLWRALLQAPLFVASTGPLSRPSFGVALGGGASFENWRVSLELAEWLRVKLPAKEVLGYAYAAEVDRQAASLWGCRAFLRTPPFEVAPCLTLSLQHISAQGTGDHLQSHSREATWLAPGVGAQARLYLASWFSLVAAANAEIETSRPQILVDGINGSSGTDEIGRIAPGAVTIALGSEWIL
jgi:hypothetical protein